jgi:hypothetical protein
MHYLAACVSRSLAYIKNKPFSTLQLIPIEQNIEIQVGGDN